MKALTNILVDRLLRDIFPMPRLVKVRIKPELAGVLDQPFIGRRLDLYQAVRVFGRNRFAANV